MSSHESDTSTDTTNTRAVRAPVRTVELEAIAEGAADGPPWTFSGIAVAAGDVLTMDDGTPVLFAEEELRKAAETQADEPLTVDHPEDEEGRPQYPPPTDETIGRVEKAGWIESARGVGYEAATHDAEIAQGVQSGSFEVSVHPTFELAEQDPETGAFVAENIEFRDLSVVSVGDSPSNTAEWGPNQALAELTAVLDVRRELTAVESLSVEEDREAVIETLVEEGLDRDHLEAADDNHLDRLAEAFDVGATPLEEKTIGELTPAEAADALADELGLVHEDDLKEKLAETDSDGEDEATGGLSTEEEERLEAYGTGTQKSSHDPPSGGTASKRRAELLAKADGCETMAQFAMAIGAPLDRAREIAYRYGLEGSLEEDSSAYGTGVAGE